MSSNLPAKSSRKSPQTREVNGGKLRIGNPGNKGGGRPPDEFKAKMRELASSDAALEYLRACVDGEHGPQAAVAAHKHITERGYGKESIEVTGKEGGPIAIDIVHRVVDP